MNLKVREKNKKKYVAIPWFSWEEWEYVYKKICSNKMEDLKEAYNQILVWKTRAYRLAVGIESTIPLLQAYIAQMDPNMEFSFKNAILNMAVVRFLGIATKACDHQFKKDGTFQQLALKMNIPLYIVQLRNDIVHGDSLYGSFPTLMSAVEVAFAWVKANYWEEERKKLRLLGLIHPVEEGVTSSKNPAKKPKNFKYFSRLLPFIAAYLDDLLISTKKFNSWTKKHEVTMSKKIKKFLLKMETYLPDEGGDLVKFLVAKIFYSKKIEKFVEKGKRPKAERKVCICKCPLPKCFVKQLSFILKFITENDLINSFLEELINQGKRHELLYHLWFETIIGTAIPDSVKRCQAHLLPEDEFERFNEAIEWKHLLFLLLSSGNHWNCDIAFRISTFDEASVSPESREKLKKITDVFIGGANNEKTDDSTKEIDTSEKIFSLEDVLGEAKKTTKALRKRPQITKSNMVLGVLPHQENDPKFFLKLLLPPFESPDAQLLKEPLDSTRVKRRREQVDSLAIKRRKNSIDVAVTENCVEL